MPITPPRFKPISWAPGYRVGNDGSVWSSLVMVRGSGTRFRFPSNNWKLLKQTTCARTKRKHVSISVNGKRYTRHIHTLVLEAFVGPCPEGMEACHFPDRDPGNNKLTNLRWDTYKNNHADAVVHGTKGVGELTPFAKLTSEQVREIKEAAKYHKSIKPYGYRIVIYKLFCERFGVTESAIRHILKGECWEHIVVD